MHQNLPQFSPKTMSPTVFLTLWINSPKPCRRCIWFFLSKPRRRFIYFDDGLGHGNHSGELLLFVGCIVIFVVSFLICMFQDSVPAGSYNDPFLSSVCVCVCMCIYIYTYIYIYRYYIHTRLFHVLAGA